MQESSPSSALNDPPSSRFGINESTEILRCVGDCAKLSMIFLLKCTLFGIIPIMSLFLTLALPILSAVPSDRVAILGVVGLSVYNTIFLAVFGIVLCPSSFWTESLSQYLVKYRKRRGHWQLLSPRRFKQLVKYHRFSIFIHGTDAERPVHLQTMDWGDTVGSHGLTALSRITLSVPLLGANRSSLREPSARYKAAVEAEKDQSDDEPAQRRKRKRKTAQPRVAKPANLNVDAEESASGEDFVVDDDEASSESTDSEVGLTVEGEEVCFCDSPLR
ncbi:hypothetical protein B0H14DRAFT_2565127 [Mycena olivaceomarginata]|nr:hypothetical protein B0H14DRAFT_2565127 [Mycena olivaceomarginata]